MNKIIIEQVAKHRKEAETLVRAFYDHPEISMEETASSRAIVDALALLLFHRCSSKKRARA